MVSRDSFQEEPRGEEQEKLGVERDREENEWNLSEVNTRAVPRRQSELVGKLAVDDVISIAG